MNQTNKELLERVLLSYRRYYDIKTENAVQPFDAEAEFHARNEQYFLIKSAKLAIMDSNEYVFFATEDNLKEEKVKELAEKAWNTGLSRVNPVNGHRNSDVTLIILSSSITKQAKKRIKRTRHYKSYLFTFRGWSHFKLAAAETSTGKVFFNGQGSELKKTLKSAMAVKKEVTEKQD